MFALAGLMFLSSLSCFAATGYSVQVIPPPSGFGISDLVGINSSGQVAGTAGAELPPRNQAFIGSPSGSVMLPLPGLLPAESTFAAGINDNGQVVGTAELYAAGSYFYIPFVATASGIDGPPGLTSPSSGLAINNSGKIAGSTYVAADHREELFIGTAASVNIIAPPSGWSLNTVAGMNSSGQVVGWAWNGSLLEEFIATGSSFASIPLPSGWGNPSYYWSFGAINDSGVVVGTTISPSDSTISTAFIGSSTGSNAIPLPAGATTARAFNQSINNSGIVVGESDAGGWIWDATNGTRLLNNSVPQGWNITSATSISNNGLILAQGSLNGGDGQFVELIPTVPATPAPSSWLLAVIGLATIIALKGIACFSRSPSRQRA